jgi:hypothetical protein
MLRQPDVAEPELFGKHTCSICWPMRAVSSSGAGDRDRVSHPKRTDGLQRKPGKLTNRGQQITDGGHDREQSGVLIGKTGDLQA